MIQRRKRSLVIVGGLVLALVGFLAWRLLRPLNIFVVAEAFERPMTIASLPEPLTSLSAEECKSCHEEIYDEWATSMHRMAWIDPYFQVDWVFDGSPQVCKNCHIPLDRQQEHTVLGFRDADKWDPILETNPDFDPDLQREGVTCLVCHIRDGRILGPYGDNTAPHPVSKMEDVNQSCMKCHVVGGERWDTFYSIPPCGTVAEIRDVAGEQAKINCVECHMPVVERPIVEDGPIRSGARHLWRGGHDRETVRAALQVRLEQEPSEADERAFTMTLTNTGSAHYLPTGTPDRHLTLEIRLLDAQGGVLQEERHALKRTILWRPFIVDLWDTRLPRDEPRTYRFAFSLAREPRPLALETVVRYHLLHEDRRKRIGYENEEPIAYEVFRDRREIRPPD